MPKHAYRRAPGVPAAPRVSVRSAVARLTVQPGPSDDADLVDMADERAERRATRNRPAVGPETEPAPAAAAPAPVPPPAPAPPVLPGCSGARPTGRYANGQLPASVLCTLPGSSGQSLRADAAASFAGLASAYRETFGSSICVTDGYRTLGEQQVLRRAKPSLSARPGTSEHGLGLAVDLACGIESYRSPQHAWLRANAERFGWYLPTWARQGGSKPEPWHWEYRD